MVVQSGRTSVSAVIPAYNAEQFISDPIQSILAQSYEISEIIVVDDGSADHTAEVAAGFPRTRVIRGPNGGQAAARNTGVYAASGEWIAFLDHDDLWLPRKTEIQLEYVTPDAGVIHSERFDPIQFGNLWHRQAHVSPSGALVRKQALLDAGGFEESRAVQGVEDLTLWLKIALTDWRFVSSEIGLYQWRRDGAEPIRESSEDGAGGFGEHRDGGKSRKLPAARNRARERGFQDRIRKESDRRRAMG